MALRGGDYDEEDENLAPTNPRWPLLINGEQAS